MNDESCKIFPLGIDALTIDFGNRIATELNEKAVRLSEYFEENPFPGFVESVPAYASVTIFFDVLKVKKSLPEFATAFDAVRDLSEKALKNLVVNPNKKFRTIEIPVDFSPENAIDLEFVAARRGLTAETVVEIFTSRTYRVFMLGFMPGFAYMGEVDERIAAPRKTTPRLVVPKGSVGIAGRQTGVYPFDSPGGWQIIGKTDFEFFAPDKENPCAVKAGDLVRFYASGDK